MLHDHEPIKNERPSEDEKLESEKELDKNKFQFVSL